MKLFVTADDYGISDAVTDGIIKCARDGVLTQTGLFTNMPGATYAVERIKDYPHICLGQDINLVAGKPVTDPKLIPTLVQEDGSFMTSKMHRFLDKIRPNHISYEDAYLETENQVKKFIELVGRKPEYIGGHAYGTEETNRALADVAEKYDIFQIMPFLETLKKEGDRGVASNWCTPKALPDGSYDYGVETQLENDPLQMFIDGKLSQLKEGLKEDGIVDLHTHAGYVDRDLFRRSSFTMVRLMEADFICSDELKDWIKENNVELISVRDLKK